MVRLRNKAIIEMSEKDLYDRLKQIRADLFKLNVESKKGTLRKESGKLKPHRKNIARILTRINELKRNDEEYRITSKGTKERSSRK